MNEVRLSGEPLASAKRGACGGWESTANRSARDVMGQVVASGWAANRMETPFQNGSVLDASSVKRVCVALAMDGENITMLRVRSRAGSMRVPRTVNSLVRRKPAKATRYAVRIVMPKMSEGRGRATS